MNDNIEDKIDITRSIVLSGIVDYFTGEGAGGYTCLDDHLHDFRTAWDQNIEDNLRAYYADISKESNKKGGAQWLEQRSN